MVQLMHSFAGFTVPPNVREAVHRGDVASFCLFMAMNVQSPRQLRALTDELRQIASDGGQLQPIIGIDQEGGQLIAITGGATELPGNMALGATRSVELAEKAGWVLGRELLAMGINLNFAPSVDINFNPRNPVIGTRAFGSEPQLVAELGTAMIRGMQSTGLIATAKHFPGHGDTQVDSHHEMPVIAHAMQRLKAVELLPFRAAIQESVGAILTAHVVFAALDEKQPATLSQAILTDLLRAEMGFDGLIITDAMDMHAVAQFGAEISVEAAINAGADLILLAHLPEQIALTETLLSKQNSSAIERINKARRNLPDELPDIEIVGCEEHQAIARAIAEQSVTLVRDKSHALPLRLEEGSTIAIISVQPLDLTPADTSSFVTATLADSICTRWQNIQTCTIRYGADGREIKDALQHVENADVVIVSTINAYEDESQASLVRALQQRGQLPIVVALRMPYDITAFPDIETYLCTYSVRPVSLEAVTQVLFGEIEAVGKLPVEIPDIPIES